MENKKIDLHTHTTFSDGVEAPESIIKKAVANGIETLSITDHDTCEAYTQITNFLNSLKCSLYVVPGIEFSSKTPEFSHIHILGYNFDMQNSGIIQLQARVKEIQLARKNILENILYDFHLTSIADAFNEYLTKIHGLRNTTFFKFLQSQNIDNQTLSNIKAKYYNAISFLGSIDQQAGAVIDVIHNANGTAILAHPSKYRLDDLQTSILFADMLKLNIDGIEVFHPSNSLEQQIMLFSFCDDNNLIISGGSDFHANPTVLGAKNLATNQFVTKNDLSSQLFQK